MLWKPLASGHDLSKDALDLAYAWFDALLSGVSSMQYGEDDTFQIGKRIDEEPLQAGGAHLHQISPLPPQYSFWQAMRVLWRKLQAVSGIVPWATRQAEKSANQTMSEPLRNAKKL